MLEKVNRNNIDHVVNGLAEFYSRIVGFKQFNLQEFVGFMEPKFAEAGYRKAQTLTNNRQTNILIIHDTGAGDLITQSGVLREIRNRYPNAHITMIVTPHGFELAECCPYVDELIINEQKHARWDFLQGYAWNINIARQLLERYFDICYAFIHHPATPTLMYMSGAKTRITHAFADDREAWNEKCTVPLRYTINLATHNFPMFAYGGHVIDACFSLLDHQFHIPIANRSIEAWYSPLDLTNARSLLANKEGSIYALTMGGSGFPKHYPPEKYARLLEFIIQQEPNATFVILGGGQMDLHSAEIIKDTVPKIYADNIADLTDRVKYRQRTAILSLCDMYIGNDTGTMHAATAVKCPVLMPSCFAADRQMKYTDIPSLWYPYGVPSVTVQPAHSLHECATDDPYTPYGCHSNRPHCITQIEPETLFKGFKLLKERIEQKNIEPLYIH